MQKKDVWCPAITEDLRELYDSVHQEFPYLEACIWLTRWLVSFFHHVPIGYLNIIDTDGESLEVWLPDINGILGDKLTAFAPATIGIPTGIEKELEIIKQLFDIGNL